MDVLGFILRVLLILLALGYIPLIYFRMKVTWQGAVLFLFGFFLLLVGLIYGSWLLLDDPFRGNQPFLVLGLILIHLSTLRNIQKGRGQREITEGPSNCPPGSPIP